MKAETRVKKMSNEIIDNLTRNWMNSAVLEINMPTLATNLNECKQSVNYVIQELDNKSLLPANLYYNFREPRKAYKKDHYVIKVDLYLSTYDGLEPLKEKLQTMLHNNPDERVTVYIAEKHYPSDQTKEMIEESSKMIVSGINDFLERMYPQYKMELATLSEEFPDVNLLTYTVVVESVGKGAELRPESTDSQVIPFTSDTRIVETTEEKSMQECLEDALPTNQISLGMDPASMSFMLYIPKVFELLSPELKTAVETRIDYVNEVLQDALGDIHNMETHLNNILKEIN